MASWPGQLPLKMGKKKKLGNIKFQIKESKIILKGHFALKHAEWQRLKKKKSMKSMIPGKNNNNKNLRRQRP